MPTQRFHKTWSGRCVGPQGGVWQLVELRWSRRGENGEFVVEEIWERMPAAQPNPAGTSTAAAGAATPGTSGAASEAAAISAGPEGPTADLGLRCGEA